MPQRCKVLFIDDDKLERMAFAHLLEAEGPAYDCVIAGSVAEGRHALQHHQFDIVLTDYLLGDGTAFDILSEVTKIPVIVITGEGNEEIAVKAWKAGAYDYLVKDCNHTYLKTLPITVENALAHKRASDQLRLLCGAMMSTDECVFITNMEDRIIFVNKAFCRNYGYGEEEVIGKDSSILWMRRHQNSNTRSVFRTQTARGGWEIGFYHQRKDGSIFPVSLSRSMIKDAAGQQVAVVGMVRDITDRLLVEEQLRQANHRLQQEKRGRGELAGRVWTELQRLLDERTLASGSRACAGQREPLAAAREMIADAHYVAKIDAGQAKRGTEQINLAELTAAAVDVVRQSEKSGGIEVSCQPTEGAWFVVGDREQLGHAVRNVICYAARCGGQSGRVDVSLANCTDQPSAVVQCLVSCADAGSVQTAPPSTGAAGSDDGAAGTCKDFPLRVARELLEVHGGRLTVDCGQDGALRGLCVSLPLAGPPQGNSRPSPENHQELTPAGAQVGGD